MSTTQNRSSLGDFFYSVSQFFGKILPQKNEPPVNADEVGTSNSDPFVEEGEIDDFLGEDEIEETDEIKENIKRSQSLTKEQKKEAIKKRSLELLERDIERLSRQSENVQQSDEKNSDQTQSESSLVQRAKRKKSTEHSTSSSSLSLTRSSRKRKINNEEISSNKKMKHESKTTKTKVQQKTEQSLSSPQLTNADSITTKRRRRESKKTNQKNEIQITKELFVDSSGRVRYESVILNNKEFKVGDHVYLRSPKGQPYIARIEGLFKDHKGEVMALVRWFYRTSDIPQSIRKKKDSIHESELYGSWHFDVNSPLCFLTDCIPQIDFISSHDQKTHKCAPHHYWWRLYYDHNERTLCNFLTNENVNKTKTVMESDEDLNKREFLQNLLKAIIRSYRRDVDDVNRLSGWLMWIVTLYKSLTTHNKSKYLDLDNSGLSIPFETTTQALSILHEKKDSSDNETSIMPEKLLHSLYTKLHIKEDNFLAQLEILLAHLFILIILRIRETLESLKFLEIIFDQRQVTRTNDKNSSLAADAFEPKVVAVGEQPVLRLVRLLTLHYRALEEHHTLKSINKQVFSQVFYFMSSSALNKMLTSSEFCRALRAYAMKMAFSHLEIWATRRDLVVPLREHFEIILQACSLLMLDKNVCSNEDVLSNVFSKLNAKQIKQLLNSFQPDELAPNPVPMSARMTVDKLASNVTAELLCDINRIVVVTKLNQ